MTTDIELASAVDAPTLDMDRESIRPRLIALLCCDVLERLASGKPLLVGVFDRITLPAGSDFTTPINIWARAANVGTGPVELRIHDPSGSAVAAVVFEGERRSADLSPHIPEVIEFGFMFQFKVTTAGSYFLNLLYNGQPLGGSWLRVILQETATDDEE